jgi:hypothetical protein
VRRSVLAAVLAATAAATAGCASEDVALTATNAAYSCEDITVPVHTLTEGRRASELSAAGRQAVLQIEGVTRKNLASWRIVEDSTARVTIIRPLARPETEGGRVVASHQYVDRLPTRKTDPVRPAWMNSIPLTCTLREVPAGLETKTPTGTTPPASTAPGRAGKAAPPSKAPAEAPQKSDPAKTGPAKKAPTKKAPAKEAPAKEPPAPRDMPVTKALGSR